MHELKGMTGFKMVQKGGLNSPKIHSPQTMLAKSTLLCTWPVIYSLTTQQKPLFLVKIKRY